MTTILGSSIFMRSVPGCRPSAPPLFEARNSLLGTIAVLTGCPDKLPPMAAPKMGMKIRLARLGLHAGSDNANTPASAPSRKVDPPREALIPAKSGTRSAVCAVLARPISPK